MKKGARFVTSITATCYFVCYTPTVVAYIILSVRPEIMSGLEPPYALIVDFLLRILSHLNSCVLPLCLVTGKTLNRLQLAAKITRRSTIRLKESSDPWEGDWGVICSMNSKNLERSANFWDNLHSKHLERSANCGTNIGFLSVQLKTRFNNLYAEFCLKV